MVSLNPLKWFRGNDPTDDIHRAVRSDILSPNFEASYLGGGSSPAVLANFDGDKFYGGFGDTKIFTTDYWALRRRSSQLFTENLYARGLIRRLITNEINTGLMPESIPDEEIIGVAQDSLSEWTEDVENRYGLYCKNPELCDYQGKMTMGAIQRMARLEALVNGDVLVVLRQSRRYNLPKVQLISGDRVQTPLGGDENTSKGNTIKYGVELNPKGRVVAHWVLQDDGTNKRIPAVGPKSGRRLSWLVYGTDRRLNAVRGEPLLSLILQSLKEIDRYRDSTQRKATNNSTVAMVVTKNQDKPGTLPVTGGAVRRDHATVTDGDGIARDFNISSQLPGIAIEELQFGEDIVFKGGEGTDVNFGTFESVIMQAVAWANEVPPEILTLAFSNNYSASQAAINEFKIYLNKVWNEIGEDFCTPVYVDWLLSETLNQKIKAPGLLKAWRDPSLHDVYGAWISSEWTGTVKISTDVVKQVKGSKMLIEEGLSTGAREARITNGTKFSKNIKRIKRENQLKVDAARPLAEFNKEFGEETAATTLNAINEIQATRDELEEIIETLDNS